MNAKKNIYIVAASLVVLLLIAAGVWFFFFRSSAPTQTNNQASSFGSPANNTSGGVGNTSLPNGTQTVINNPGQAAQQKIFQISSAPVVGATLIQTLHPTTTLARYIRQEDGHVFDLPLDVPGAVPRVVSNVTIPGGMRAVWVEGGNAVMQYLDGNTVKSVYLGFPTSTSTDASVTLPTKIRFLPDAIVDVAASPDGTSIAYMLKTSSGVDGYIAKADGTGSKKTFVLPLSQVLLSWPSPGNLLVQTKSAAGVPGMLFSVEIKSGSVTPLVYGAGITATADRAFSKVVYQLVPDTGLRSSYAHDVKTGADRALSFDPYPEKCAWSPSAISIAFCATPLAYVPLNYLDLWHVGAASVADALFSFNVATGQTTIVATPGGADGGVQSDMLEIAVSLDGHYLSFTNKGSRTLWGVRLGSQ